MDGPSPQSACAAFTIEILTVCVFRGQRIAQTSFCRRRHLDAVGCVRLREHSSTIAVCGKANKRALQENKPSALRVVERRVRAGV